MRKTNKVVVEEFEIVTRRTNDDEALIRQEIREYLGERVFEGWGGTLTNMEIENTGIGYLVTFTFTN